MKRWIFILAFFACALNAGIKLVDFKNDSDYVFNPTFCNGTPIEGALLEHAESCIATADDTLMITFEEAGLSGFFHPQWKFNVWLESDNGFPYFTQNRILYAVIFYDEEGEVSVRWDEKGKLHLIGGSGVKDIVYPWAQATIGRGNPYHEVKGVETDLNGINYYDYQGFVGYPQLPKLF